MDCAGQTVERHSFGPYIEGMGNPFEHFDSEENRKMYELQQRQRALERRIRKTKREVMGLKTAVDNADDPELKSKLEQDYQRKAALLQKQNKEYNDFCKENDLRPLSDRLKIARWDRQQAAAARGAARRYESDKINSGAISGARNPYGKAAQDHAERYYGLVRNMKTDVSQIAKATGFTEEQIQEVKNYIFVDKHDLGGTELEMFEPDYMMAESWRRLIAGKPEFHDLTLLQHEIMEADLVKQGYSQDEAHIITSAKYNYDKEASAFYDKIKKYKKD